MVTFLKSTIRVPVPSPNVNHLPVSSFASGALVKSLNYVRSLVAQYIPKRSFQPAAFAGAAPASRQALPTLSSLLSRSFNSQLSPANGKESLESKDTSITSVSEAPIAEEVDELGDLEFMALDVFRWRWCGDQQPSLLLPKSDHILNLQDMQTQNFLEVGAAALLVGDMEAKMKGKAWRIFGSADMPYLDQLLQPSLLTTVTNSTSAFAHLRAITALKRSKPGANQFWEDSPLSTFRPRARPLFQYRHYSEQQPLRLNPVEVCEVIAAVCSGTYSANSNHLTVSSKLRHSGRPSMDVAVSVLVKLVCVGFETAAPLALSLLEPPAPDGSTTIEEQYSQEAYFDNGTQVSSHGIIKSDYLKKTGNASAIDKFECWILGILFEILLHLVQIEEKEEAVWASSLSCLLYFVCDRGKIRRSRLRGLDIRQGYIGFRRVEDAVHFGFSYTSDKSEYLVLSNSREDRRNLYLVLFDYVLHKINETCIAAGVSEYSDDEVRPIATLLVLADAPEALHISLLEKIVEKFDTLIGSFTHVDKEFTQMIQITKLFKSIESVDGGPGNIAAMNAKLSWTTLHSLLHSERNAYRHNGYLWLGDLLIAEISGEGDTSLWSSIRNLEKKISLAGVNDYSASLGVPLPIWLMCGLLKSKNNQIRWGFLFVLERLLIQCKFLLDENEVQNVMRSQSPAHVHDKSRLEKANAVIDIMSCALSLMAQINETDRMNILKLTMLFSLDVHEQMCDILLSQLCLKVADSNALHTKDSSNSERMSKADGSLTENVGRGDFIGDPNTKVGKNVHIPICDTASMAALLLHGRAIVPMQLVARVPSALFYWPLIQLAGAATDNIALGVSVGSKGRGNLPGGTSDIRATLLLLLIGKCTADPAAFVDVGGEEFFRYLFSLNSLLKVLVF
ncbi:hypothetical protein DH2020_044151 [Rehmannia glutinosa]|uniref:Uncharacterized protein n=1 Tax=Rehmannia glutinosa TaxID=99300 RepID=A0ABR0UI58_REHGL